MSYYLSIAFIFISLSVFISVPLRKKDVLELINIFNSEVTLKQLAKTKQNKLILWFKRTKSMLNATGQGSKFTLLILLSIMLFTAGIFIGLLFNNYYLVPIVSITLGILPFIYIQFQYIEYKHFVVEELETALSIVTSSYERCENIVLAFEENIEYIGQPIKSIFQEFLFSVNQANISTAVAIEDMKLKINNNVFIEWCEALKRCVYDRSLKTSLRPVVNKLSDIKIATGELKNILYNAKRTFFQLLIISIVMLFLAFYVLPKGFNIPLPSSSSKCILAINIALIIGISIKALIETKDVDFDL